MIANVIEVTDDRCVVAALHRSPKTLWLWPFHYSKFVSRMKHTARGGTAKDWVNAHTGEMVRHLSDVPPYTGARMCAKLSGAVTAHLLKEELKDVKPPKPDKAERARPNPSTGIFYFELKRDLEVAKGEIDDLKRALMRSRETCGSVSRDRDALRAEVKKQDKEIAELRSEVSERDARLARGAGSDLFQANLILRRDLDRERANIEILRKDRDEERDAVKAWEEAAGILRADLTRANREKENLRKHLEQARASKTPKHTKLYVLGTTVRWEIEKASPEYGPDATQVTAALVCPITAATLFMSTIRVRPMDAGQVGTWDQQGTGVKLTIPAKTLNAINESLVSTA